MLNRNEDTIDFTADIDGEDYVFEIAFIMGEDVDHNDKPIRIIEGWRVHKVNGAPNMLGQFWADQLNAEFICDEIMEKMQ